MLKIIPRIERATHQIALHLSRATALGVSQGEAHILVYLSNHGEQTVAQIHREFGHRRSTLTSILDRLDQRQLITRQVSAADRRSFVIRLTPSGRRLGARVYTRLRSLERRIQQQVSAKDLAGFAAVIQATAKIAGESPAAKAGPRRRVR